MYGAGVDRNYWLPPIRAWRISRSVVGAGPNSMIPRSGDFTLDPDAPAQSINVDFYFDGPAGASGAMGMRVLANQHRDDLCAAIGSCEHAFDFDVPLGVRDGKSHEVHAYGIDTAEVTMIGNRITAVINGVKVHDNVECPKGTGGQIDDNVNEPGPIMLQGDHGTVSFRNVQIKELP